MYDMARMSLAVCCEMGHMQAILTQRNLCASIAIRTASGRAHACPMPHLHQLIIVHGCMACLLLSPICLDLPGCPHLCWHPEL